MRDISRFAAAFIAIGLLAGCSINAHHDNDEKKGSKVDIDSPMGSLHVQTEDKAKHDTGIAIYPGARPAPPEEHDSSAANVSLGFAGFGLKVVAAKYLTDDSPEKVLAYYRKELTKFGKVIECTGGDVDIHGNQDNQAMTCEHSSTQPGKTELGVGDHSVRHVVSVKPKGNGTQFSLVYLQTSGNGKDRETM